MRGALQRSGSVARRPWGGTAPPRSARRRLPRRCWARRGGRGFAGRRAAQGPGPGPAARRGVAAPRLCPDGPRAGGDPGARAGCGSSSPRRRGRGGLREAPSRIRSSPASQPAPPFPPRAAARSRPRLPEPAPRTAPLSAGRLLGAEPVSQPRAARSPLLPAKRSRPRGVWASSAPLGSAASGGAREELPGLFRAPLRAGGVAGSSFPSLPAPEPEDARQNGVLVG